MTNQGNPMETKEILGRSRKSYENQGNPMKIQEIQWKSLGFVDFARPVIKAFAAVAAATSGEGCASGSFDSTGVTCPEKNCRPPSLGVGGDPMVWPDGTSHRIDFEWYIAEKYIARHYVSALGTREWHIENFN